MTSDVQRRQSFSLKQLLAAVALFGVAIACGRALIMLFVGASTAYYAAILFIGMVSTASAGIGASAGRPRMWAMAGITAAIPFAAILISLFQVAEV